MFVSEEAQSGPAAERRRVMLLLGSCPVVAGAVAPAGAKGPLVASSVLLLVVGLVCLIEGLRAQAADVADAADAAAPWHPGEPVWWVFPGPHSHATVRGARRTEHLAWVTTSTWSRAQPATACWRRPPPLPSQRRPSPPWC